MKVQKEKMDVEKEEMRSYLVKQVQEQNLEVQRRMREEMGNERNREIEAVIEKLGDETHTQQKLVEKQYQIKFEQLKKDYAKRSEQYEQQIRSLEDKYRKECEVREMLDDNLKTVLRRVDELQLQLDDKSSKLDSALEFKSRIDNQLECVHNDHEFKLKKVVQEFMQKLESKEAEVRAAKLELQ